eukprot:TRINITY_DN3139_c0_g1_i2.p1 TRINITY_DN3139_c0_g1~~TRINITY_DN3139_c0_g1_i2.p1  ORF type:complete len:652 (-),score=80.35 TRINITY_DN3139_c0_g1_i2:864-2819(-)
MKRNWCVVRLAFSSAMSAFFPCSPVFCNFIIWQWAAEEIRKMAKSSAGTREELRNSGVILPLAALLQEMPIVNLTAMETLVLALLNLAIGNEINKQLIASAGIIPRFVELLKQPFDCSLLEPGAAATDADEADGSCWTIRTQPSCFKLKASGPRSKRTGDCNFWTTPKSGNSSTLKKRTNLSDSCDFKPGCLMPARVAEVCWEQESTTDDCFVNGYCTPGALFVAQIATAMLLTLSASHDLRPVLGSSGCLPALVAMLQAGDEQAKYDAVRALLNMSWHFPNINNILKSGAVPALTELLLHGSTACQLKAATVLENIAGSLCFFYACDSCNAGTSKDCSSRFLRTDLALHGDSSSNSSSGRRRDARSGRSCRDIDSGDDSNSQKISGEVCDWNGPISRSKPSSHENVSGSVSRNVDLDLRDKLEHKDKHLSLHGYEGEREWQNREQHDDRQQKDHVQQQILESEQTYESQKQVVKLQKQASQTKRSKKWSKEQQRSEKHQWQEQKCVNGIYLLHSCILDDSGSWLKYLVGATLVKALVLKMQPTGCWRDECETTCRSVSCLSFLCCLSSKACKLAESEGAIQCSVKLMLLGCEKECHSASKLHQVLLACRQRTQNIIAKSDSFSTGLCVHCSRWMLRTHKGKQKRTSCFCS